MATAQRLYFQLLITLITSQIKGSLVTPGHLAVVIKQLHISSRVELVNLIKVIDKLKLPVFYKKGEGKGLKSEEMVVSPSLDFKRKEQNSESLQGVEKNSPVWLPAPGGQDGCRLRSP